MKSHVSHISDCTQTHIPLIGIFTEAKFITRAVLWLVMSWKSQSIFSSVVDIAAWTYGIKETPGLKATKWR